MLPPRFKVPVSCTPIASSASIRPSATASGYRPGEIDCDHFAKWGILARNPRLTIPKPPVGSVGSREQVFTGAGALFHMAPLADMHDVCEQRPEPGVDRHASPIASAEVLGNSRALPSVGNGAYGPPIVILLDSKSSRQNRAWSGERSYISSIVNVLRASGGEVLWGTAASSMRPRPELLTAELPALPCHRPAHQSPDRRRRASPSW